MSRRWRAVRRSRASSACRRSFRYGTCRRPEHCGCLRPSQVGFDHRRHGDGRDFVFLLLRLAPGDPAAMIAGRSATAEMIVGIREKLGLNDPMPVQFIRWVRDMLRGDFGTSIFAGRPVFRTHRAAA